MDLIVMQQKTMARADVEIQQVDDDGGGPSSWESDATVLAQELPNPSQQLRESPEDGYQHRTTPELCAEPSECPPSTKKVFPLFRPKSEWKTIHIIRHGESEFNAACTSKPGFADPQIYNPKLTQKGRRQAEKLRERLSGMNISKEALWVTSPMTRALETMMLGCPHSARIGNADKPLNVVVRGELAEQCQTTGDIGLPASHVRESFPQFAEAIKDLPERWWFKHAENDAVQKRFLRHETKAQMRLRVGVFRKWVSSRPEKVIVAFGHNCLFKELTNGQKSLRNCEVHTMCI